MKTYKDIDEFVLDVFPLEYEQIIKRKKTSIDRAIERIDNVFSKELEETLKGKEDS